MLFSAVGSWLGGKVRPWTWKSPFIPPSPSGRLMTAPAESVPGRFRIRPIRLSKNATSCADSLYFDDGREMSIVKTFSAWKPGSTARIWAKLRNNKPDPTNSSAATAIWETPNALRGRLRAEPLGCDQPSFNVSLRPDIEICSAGARPNKAPESREANTRNASTRQSMAKLSGRGMDGGHARRSKSEPHSASRKPAIPPSDESNRLSARVWEVRRPRLAPNAARTANSLARAEARASKMFATFARSE